MRYSLLILATALSLAGASVAEEARTTIGVLTCTLGESTSDQASTMTCGFKPVGVGADEKYVGSVQGLPQGAIGKQVLVWAVIGPPTKLPSGLLAQRYSKSKLPGHPPAWVGETNSAIVLQFETHADAELGNAIVQVDLKLSGTSA
jgi:Protein of unknown function (DUF992)